MASKRGGAGTHPPLSVPQWGIDPNWTGVFVPLTLTEQVCLCIYGFLLLCMSCFTAAGGVSSRVKLSQKKTLELPLFLLFYQSTIIILVCWYAVYKNMCTSGKMPVNQGVRRCYLECIGSVHTCACRVSQALKSLGHNSLIPGHFLVCARRVCLLTNNLEYVGAQGSFPLMHSHLSRCALLCRSSKYVKSHKR